LTAFVQQSGKQRFEEIDVERINVIEKDGQVKLVLANKARLPGPGNVITGKFTQRAGPKGPGILFYNEKGDEAGGLSIVSVEQNGKFSAGDLLAFDKYGGDQVVGMRYEDVKGKRKAGFIVWDQPDASPEEQRKNYIEAHKLHPGPERDKLMQQAVASQRVFIGRSDDRSANVTLFDANSRPRLRLSVRPDGDPKLEFLDAAGNVTQAIPASSK
ncbi:MAG TPA: hypothetical protein VFZ99_01095, partial [Terriglobales bacterium]